LQLLELGRGVLTNLQLEVRSDISVLAASHRNLAQQFQNLRDQIDTPLITDSPINFDSTNFSNPLQNVMRWSNSSMIFYYSFDR
jgi:hypothetical protein